MYSVKICKITVYGLEIHDNMQQQMYGRVNAVVTSAIRVFNDVSTIDFLSSVVGK